MLIVSFLGTLGGLQISSTLTHLCIEDYIDHFFLVYVKLKCSGLMLPVK